MDATISSFTSAHGYNNDYTGIPVTWTDSGENFCEDPLFVDVITLDYHQQKTFPCINGINVGTTTAPEYIKRDVENNVRINPDVGADEYYLSALPFISLLLDK